MRSVTESSQFLRVFLPTLSSYNMKMGMWFWNFDSTSFDGIIARADSYFVHP